MVDLRRIGVYLTFAFGFTWAIFLVVYLTGGLASSRALVAGTPITIAAVLLPFGTFSPALANVLTRFFTEEGWEQLYLRPHLRRAWSTWVIAWLGPVLLISLGAVAFFVAFPHFFDPSLGSIRKVTENVQSQTGRPFLPPGVLLVSIVLAAVFLRPIFAGFFAFGEEFGWRAYLLPRLLPLGERRAAVITGIIWGIWHWPLIAMGYDYGFDYPYFPWLGMLMFVWSTYLLRRRPLGLADYTRGKRVASRYCPRHD